MLPTGKNFTSGPIENLVNGVFASPLTLSLDLKNCEVKKIAQLDLKCLGNKSYYKQLDTILNIIEKDTLEEMKFAGL